MQNVVLEVKPIRQYPFPGCLYWAVVSVFGFIDFMLFATTIKNVGEYPILWLFYIGCAFPAALLIFLKKRFAKMKIVVFSNMTAEVHHPFVVKKFSLLDLHRVQYRTVFIRRRTISALAFYDNKNEELTRLDGSFYSYQQMVEVAQALKKLKDAVILELEIPK